MSLLRRPGTSVRVRVQEYVGGRQLSHEDRLATEEPLEIRLTWPGRRPYRVAVTMRTPGHDFDLAAGLLFSEGVLAAGEITSVAYCTDTDLPPDQEFNVVTVTLAGPPRQEPVARYDGPAAAASACGVCGAQSIDEVLALTDISAGVSWSGPVVGTAVLCGLPARLRSAQRVFESTGGLHAAGLFTGDGEPLLVREDIGRHNAVDKVVGARLLAGEPTAVPVLCVSGRIGFEIVQKAVAAGVGVVAAIGAPSSLAARLAAESGLGLVGFLTPERFVCYAGSDRIGV